MPLDQRAPRSLQATYDALLTLITGRRSAPPAPAAGVTDDDRDDDRDHLSDGDPLDQAASLVVGDARATAGERVHVYQHMYRARIAEALESQFPRLARWLGADALADLAFAYVTDQPSRHPSLRFIGQHLPAWLAARPPAPAPERHPALAALARLEWARADIFDAADQAPLALDAVRVWPADRFAALPLRLIGAHRLLSVEHPVAALWDAIGPGTVAAAPERLDQLARDAAQPACQRLLIWRQGVSVFHRAVDDAEHAALQGIARGTTFGVVCEGLLGERDADQATAQAFAWLSTWCADELLAAD